jgi:hypothetical protein
MVSTIPTHAPSACSSRSFISNKDAAYCKKIPLRRVNLPVVSASIHYGKSEDCFV